MVHQFATVSVVMIGDDHGSMLLGPQLTNDNVMNGCWNLQIEPNSAQAPPREISNVTLGDAVESSSLPTLVQV
jgi:hypothetical protein